MQICNISRGGALLRTRGHLMPGAKVQLEFVILEDAFRLAGFVLRSSLASPKTLPRYQTAVVFDRPLQVPDYEPETKAYAPQASDLEPSPFVMIPEGIVDLACWHVGHGVPALSAAILSYSFCNTPHRVPYEMLRMNDW
jgi:hypothetical protein